VEIHREEIKRTFKEVMDKWNKTGLGEIRDTKLRKKVLNREEWKEVSVAAKTLEEL